MIHDAQTGHADSTLDDFPDWLGSMLVKELRQGVRGKAFVIPFLGVHAAMLLAFAIDVQNHLASGYGYPSRLFNLGLGPQNAFWFIAFALLGGIMPLTALKSLTAEFENRSGELLFLAGLTRWRVILGKWCTHCALAGLTAVTMLPYLLVRYFLGGMDLWVTFGLCLMVMCFNGAANAMAIGVSGYLHAGMRWLTAGTMAASFGISLLMVGISSGVLGHFVGEKLALVGDAAATVAAILGIATTCLLFCAFGWQLGRLHIRPYSVAGEELSFETVTTGGVMALTLLAPVFLGVGLVMSLGFGGLPCAALFAWVILIMDRQPARKIPK